MDKDHELEDFIRICSNTLDSSLYPNATKIEQEVPIYDGDLVRKMAKEPVNRKTLASEFYRCLKSGSGIFIIGDFYSNKNIVDRSTEIFSQIILAERRNREHKGDHFAKAGANERIWNSFQKVAEISPSDFVEYYKNPLYRLISQAWLGPGYQITAQVNIVKPDGAAQSAHRDYHLGFQPDTIVARFPLSLQIASQYLTLQGAIAHTDMPVESGPTLLLPFSQLYEHGYLTWRNQSFSDYFQNHAIQLPLNKGDAIFFSPAVFHAAGHNQSIANRTANLIQVSASFGKTMENIDRRALTLKCFPVIRERVAKNLMTPEEVKCIIGAVAEGYAFPTNLDQVTPVAGSAPENAQEIMSKAIGEDWSEEKFTETLNTHYHNRNA